jgi:2-oxoglutarate ferredoxin oxidoreductase subunit beta
MPELKDFNTVARPDWCPGCGDFGIQVAVKQALTNLQIEPHMVAIIAGIGCSGKLTHWVNTYGLHSLHGRTLPPATAVKFANPKLTVIADGGDGDGYGIGMGHFIHTIRRNVDITYLVHNNMVYGLTKGQAAPTSMKGYKSPSTPFGVIEQPVNPMALALAAGATFVARGSAGDAIHLTKIIEAGIKHKGFALIDIFQPCVTFNKINTYAFFMQNCYKLETDPNFDPSNFQMAMEKALQTDKLPIGIFYQASRPTYEEEDPGHSETAAVDLDISNIDITKPMERFL